MKRKKLVLNAITILSVAVFCVTINALLLAGGFAVYIAVNSLYIAQEDGTLSGLRSPFPSRKKLQRFTLQDKNILLSIDEEFVCGGKRYVVVKGGGCEHNCDMYMKAMCKHMDCTGTPQNEDCVVHYKLIKK